MYHDTGLANNEVAYRAMTMVVPRERVVFGTDWPYLPLPWEPGDPARGRAFFDAAERAGIENAGSWAGWRRARRTREADRPPTRQQRVTSRSICNPRSQRRLELTLER